MKPLETYDAILRQAGVEHLDTYELTLLQREFVHKVGYDILQALMNYSQEYQTILKWLMNDEEVLRLYVLGGEPDGNYVSSLKILKELYNTYKADFADTTVTENQVVLGKLYEKMAITLSLTHSANVGLWVSGAPENPNDPNGSNAIVRYAVFKKLYQAGLLENKIFENLSIEEMRFVMNNIIDDQEIEWINHYSRKNDSTNPYSYIHYTLDYNYTESQYYDALNYAKWDEKYELSDYGITYQEGYPKLWVVFEEGAVCGGLSKTGSNIWGSYGVPSSVVSQPGHAAYIYMSLDQNGQKVWNLYNDVYGWGQSGKTEKLSVRMPNGWGSGSYAGAFPASYILLAQAALSDYEHYEEAEKILMFADVYQNNLGELNKIYRRALQAQSINFDAWYGLVKLYETKNATEREFYDLAKEIADTLTYYPLPMHDLLRMIEPHFTTPSYVAGYNNLLRTTLTAASNATEQDTLQPGPTKQVANFLLQKNDTKIATFSFDGEDAGKIILSDRFDGNGVTWQYTLDSGGNWIDAEGRTKQLTTDEISKITPELDIIIRIVGDLDSVYDIDITKGKVPPSLYNNDLENRVIGTIDSMEWQLDGTNTWTSFREKEPDLSGEKTVHIRLGYSGTTTASDAVSLEFTEDEKNPKQVYVPLSKITVDRFSTDEPGHNNAAANAIDGNIHTLWHTLWNGNDKEKYIVLKTEEPIYLSKFQYVPRQESPNGRILNAQLLVSMDGEVWTEVVSHTSWKNDISRKDIELDTPVLCQYVKLVGVETYGSYASASMLHLFEDTTLEKPKVEPEPTPPEPTPTPTDSGQSMPQPTPTIYPDVVPTAPSTTTPATSATPQPTPTMYPDVVPTTPSTSIPATPQPTPNSDFETSTSGSTSTAQEDSSEKKENKDEDSIANIDLSEVHHPEVAKSDSSTQANQSMIWVGLIIALFGIVVIIL